MKIGARVVHADGGVGYVEAVDNDNGYATVDVRWLTPNNVPSCVVSTCSPGSIRVVSDSVVPMPRSAEWWEQSRAFCAAIEAALKETP